MRLFPVGSNDVGLRTLSATRYIKDFTEANLIVQTRAALRQTFLAIKNLALGDVRVLSDHEDYELYLIPRETVLWEIIFIMQI